MVNARIYIEGGGDSKELHTRCREGFRCLLEALGFSGHMPRLVACGGRSATFDDFKTAHSNAANDTYVAMLIDSEDPIADIAKTWAHLKQRDGWDKPEGAGDEQVLLMVTCMESWIVADRKTLRLYYGSKLQASALPALDDIETRDRGSIQQALSHATRNCKNAYTKGRRSFEVVAALDPRALRRHLPSLVRCERVLAENLRPQTLPGKARRP